MAKVRLKSFLWILHQLLIIPYTSAISTTNVTKFSRLKLHVFQSEEDETRIFYLMELFSYNTVQYILHV